MTERTPIADLSPQQALVAEYLLSGRTLTNVIALTSLGVQSVSRRVTELREHGYKIEKVWKEDHFGNRYVTYVLGEDA